MARNEPDVRYVPEQVLATVVQTVPPAFGKVIVLVAVGAAKARVVVPLAPVTTQLEAAEPWIATAFEDVARPIVTEDAALVPKLNAAAES